MLRVCLVCGGRVLVEFGIIVVERFFNDPRLLSSALVKLVIAVSLTLSKVLCGAPASTTPLGEKGPWEGFVDLGLYARESVGLSWGRMIDESYL